VFSFLKQKAVNLSPGYFALVMATGALSIGSFQLGMELLPKILLYINLIAYLSLWILTLIRLFGYFPNVLEDLTSHTKGPGFFTLVAGTCVLGSQLIIVDRNYSAAIFLLVLAVLLWQIIMYTFFAAVTVRRDKPAIADGMNGTWLIAVVATQSISILGTLVSSHVEAGRGVILFVTLCMYFLGCMLYINMITLIFYRFIFLRLEYSELTPPYWINMGAVAITTLAGSTLILNSRLWPLLVELTPFLKGFTLFFWIMGTWWIPLLFILMIWRYLYHRYPLSYDSQLWGMVFPLSMYTAGTFQLSKALKIPFLIVIPHIMVYIAMAAWLWVFLGFTKHLFDSLRNYSKSMAFKEKS
jgi:tellurite resistance protein TehA-like permease